MDEKDFQGAVNRVSDELKDLRDRLVAQEIHTTNQQRDVDKIQSDMLNLHTSLKGDMTELRVGIKADIDVVRDSIAKFVDKQNQSLEYLKDNLSKLTTKQAVDEAKLQTGVSAGKYFIDKLPLIASVIAAVAGVIVMVKVSGL